MSKPVLVHLVVSCNDCPFSFVLRGSAWYCMAEEEERRLTGIDVQQDERPAWCPLEQNDFSVRLSPDAVRAKPTG
jgi:hypothetical protein